MGHEEKRRKGDQGEESLSNMGQEEKGRKGDQGKNPGAERSKKKKGGGVIKGRKSLK